MATTVDPLKAGQIERIGRLQEVEPKLKVFVLKKSKKLACQTCNLELKFRDFDSLKKHLRSARHQTSAKLDRLISFYDRHYEDAHKNNAIFETVRANHKKLVEIQL